MKISTIQNQNGMCFMVRIVELNDSYGQRMALTHDSVTPKIEFYDTRYKFEKDGEIILGQFVSRYNLNSQFKEAIVDGLDLCGGVADWKIDTKAAKELLDLCKMWEI